MTKLPDVVTSRDGNTSTWRVGNSSVSVSRARGGWKARVRCRDWGDDKFSLVERHFATKEEALAWSARMADVLARDQADDQRSF